MICKKCGCSNPKGSTLCEVCATTLDVPEKQTEFKKKRKKKSFDKSKIIVFSLIIAIVAVVAAFGIIISHIFFSNKSDKIKPYEYISACHDCVLAVKNDGTVSWIDSLLKEAEGMQTGDLSHWNNIKTVAAGGWWSAGLKYDGTVVVETNQVNYDNDFKKFKSKIAQWKDIVSISAGENLLAALKSDGTVVVASSFDNLDSCFDSVPQLYDVKQIRVGIADESDYLIVLKTDGTVHSLYHSDDGYIDKTTQIYNELYDLSDWKNIDYISTNGFDDYGIIFGVTKFGKVISNYDMDIIKELLDSYYETIKNADDNNAYKQLSISTIKMYSDMFKRIEKLDVAQIIASPGVFDFTAFNYIDTLSIESNNYMYLLLDNGTVVAESPMFSFYYACNDLSDEELYDKAVEYTRVIYDRDKFNTDWLAFSSECRNVLLSTSLLNNVVALDLCCSNDYECYLTALKSDGTVYSDDKHSEVNSWTNIKTDENNKSGRIENDSEPTMLTTSNSSTTNPSTTKLSTTNPSTTSNTTIKKHQTTKTQKNTKAFYKGKYYLYADEAGQLSVCVLQLYDDHVKITYYDRSDNYTEPSYKDEFPLEWSKDRTYAKNDVGMEFLVDYDWQVIQYTIDPIDMFEVLREYDELTTNDIQAFANEYRS